jgi:hypothetical protein
LGWDWTSCEGWNIEDSAIGWWIDFEIKRDLRVSDLERAFNNDSYKKLACLSLGEIFKEIHDLKGLLLIEHIVGTNDFVVIDKHKSVGDNILVLSMFNFKLYVIIYIDCWSYKIKWKFDLDWRNFYFIDYESFFVWGSFH